MKGHFLSGTILLSLFLTISWPSPLPAQEKPDEKEKIKTHYVIKVDGEDVYIDMGNMDGVISGMVLLVYKTGISIKHPVTGKEIGGSVYLGQVAVREVSDEFCIAAAEPSIKGKLKEGFEVKFHEDDLKKIMVPAQKPPEPLEGKQPVVIAKTSTPAKTEKPKPRPRSSAGIPSFQDDIKKYRGKNNRVSTRYQFVQGGFAEDEMEFYHKAEVDLMYRIFKMLYSIKFGIGVADGQGNIATEKCDDFPCHIAFDYGFTELEFRFHDYFSVIPTFQLGMNNNGIGAGGAFKVRIGPELSTNLELGASTAALIGSQALIQFNHWFHPRFKMQSAVIWENYIAGQDVVRVTLGPEFDVTDLISLIAIFGYGGKDVDSMGPTIGIGIAFNFHTGWFWGE